MLMTQETDDISEEIEIAPQLQKAHKDTLEILDMLSPPHLSSTGPLAIPIVTVEIDNENLVFDREGVPLCSKMEDCCAHLIQGPPSTPLNVYTGPGAHGNLCLLCLRMETSMLVQMHRMCGSQPTTALLPPFTNLVNCVGGYKASACAVTPKDQAIIAGGVHIMGNPVTFRKNFNAISKKWFIDQTESVYRENTNERSVP